MSKTILAKTDGFTPVIDAVVQNVGLMTAVIFGKVWRYCQMADGVCTASQERIADELGLSRATVNGHIERLVNEGYLIDKTPNLIGRPHIYADTGKANLSIFLTGMADTCQNSLQVPVKNFDTKKELKKQIYTAENQKQKDAIVVAMENCGMFPNSNTLQFISSWKQTHSEEWIIKAIQISKGKNQNYIDKVLLGWEANGYPKSREQQVAERRAGETKPMKKEMPVYVPD